ncbi:outer dense fiber protein 3-like [Octopus sinensis]|uniref:Outer dense fiber protein 3-like n=1 Tax=Octopus sinensis TaxID=2607531 RepID=A0A6P7UB13_9MOLL|nr:outer dense fiber protein 3-like [Octopus sinensis]
MTFKPTKPRGPIAAMYSSPGPCYQLPNLIGHEGHDTRSTYQKAPSYVFGLKQESRKSGCSPGPKYNFSHLQVFRDGKDGTPQYSLYGRPKQRPTIHTPGPGSYSISPSAKSVFESAPTYSFGQRHEGRRTDTTPAPNSYSLPALLGRTIQGGKLQAPAYTLLGRKTLGSFHEDLAKLYQNVHHGIRIHRVFDKAWGFARDPSQVSKTGEIYVGRRAVGIVEPAVSRRLKKSITRHKGTF